MVASVFDRPDLAPILAGAAAIVLLALLAERWRRRRLDAAVARGRQPALCADLSPRLRRARQALAYSGLGCAALAALAPTWGEETRVVEPRGNDVLIALDVSRSMLASDLAPSRLERAKREIRALADAARGDRLGVLAFAGDARLAVPLTTDADSLASILESVDPSSVRIGGTDLGLAIDRSLDALKDASGDHEAILLLTDGEDLEGKGAAAAKRARERGVVVHAVGFGSTRGSKIAIADASGSQSFLKDPEGHEVVSQMDEAGLRRIASEAGGEFLRADAVPLPLVEVYDKRIRPMAKKAFEAQQRREAKQRFQWPLGLAVALWTLELAGTDRRRRRA
ncbi:MAG TPA: VWA domain-containing protein [Planctomycetota bacterium]|nr:VWA domain-containing protein [Planctomycetota bacterium]